MLILDKREDTETLRDLGADDRLIARIFLFEGRLISVPSQQVRLNEQRQQGNAAQRGRDASEQRRA